MMCKFRTLFVLLILVSSLFQSYPIAESDELYDWIDSGSYVEYQVLIVRSDIEEYFLSKHEILSLSGSELSFRLSRSTGWSQEFTMNVFKPSDPFYYTKNHINLLKENKLETSLYKFTYLGEDEITVPAGKFKVYKASSVGLQPEGAERGNVWIEKNTGLVIKQIDHYPKDSRMARYFTFELLRSNILEPSDGGEILYTVLDAAEKAHSINEIKRSIEESHSTQYNVNIEPPQTVPLTNPVTPLTYVVGGVTIGAAAYGGFKMILAIKLSLLHCSLHLTQNNKIVYNFTKITSINNEEPDIFVGIFENVEPGDYEIVFKADEEPSNKAALELTFIELADKQAEKDKPNNMIPGFPLSSILVVFLLYILSKNRYLNPREILFRARSSNASVDKHGIRQLPPRAEHQLNLT